MSISSPKPCENPFCKEYLYPTPIMELSYICPYCEQPQLEEFWHFATFTRLVLDETREQLMDGLSRECNPTYSQLLEKIINLGESLTKLEMTYETVEIRIISHDSPALNAFSSEWREWFHTLNQFSDTMKHYPEFYEWQPLPPHIIY